MPAAMVASSAEFGGHADAGGLGGGDARALADARAVPWMGRTGAQRPPEAKEAAGAHAGALRAARTRRARVAWRRVCMRASMNGGNDAAAKAKAGATATATATATASEVRPTRIRPEDVRVAGRCVFCGARAGDAAEAMEFRFLEGVARGAALREAIAAWRSAVAVPPTPPTPPTPPPALTPAPGRRDDAPTTPLSSPPRRIADAFVDGSLYLAAAEAAVDESVLWRGHEARALRCHERSVRRRLRSAFDAWQEAASVASTDRRRAARGARKLTALHLRGSLATWRLDLDLALASAVAA